MHHVPPNPGMNLKAVRVIKGCFSCKSDLFKTGTFSCHEKSSNQIQTLPAHAISLERNVLETDRIVRPYKALHNPGFRFVLHFLFHLLVHYRGIEPKTLSPKPKASTPNTAKGHTWNRDVPSYGSRFGVLYKASIRE